MGIKEPKYECPRCGKFTTVGNDGMFRQHLEGKRGSKKCWKSWTPYNPHDYDEDELMPGFNFLYEKRNQPQGGAK